jgi:hypothetical protein
MLSETLLRDPARLPDPVIVVPQPRPPAVLPGQHRHDVYVIRGVPDRDPANPVVLLPVRRQPRPVHHVIGQLSPLIVREHPVSRSSTHRAMPERPLQPVLAQSDMRLLEQPA